jgi:hypothetical protein
MVRCILVVFLFACASMACSPPPEEDRGVDAGPDGSANVNSSVNPMDGVTYHKEIRPLLDAHCVGCHSEGDIGPFRLDHRDEEWTEGSAAWATPIVDAVVQGRMPPWMPADDCRDLQGVRRMTQADVDTFAAWADGGFAVGAVGDYQPPVRTSEEEVEERPADLILGIPQAYSPREDRTDDYRCFVLDHEFTEEAYLQRVNIEPGQSDLVHHVIVYMMTPEELSDLPTQGPEGYECFGSPGGLGGQNIGGWVPGMVTQPTAPDTAMVVKPGSKLVLQMHYNLAGNRTRPDQTKAHFWMMPDGAVPAKQMRIIPFADLGIRIEAGDTESRHVREFTIPYDMTIVGITPHMHTLGTSISVDYLPDAGEEACLISIEDWDFNWQQSYFFGEGLHIDAKRGDRWKMTCTYDNSPSHQPMIDGELKQTSVVRWGDGTFDEMCLSYAVGVFPYDPENDRMDCSVVGECVAACAEGDAACFLQCNANATGDCIQCALASVIGCGSVHCQTDGLALLGCNNRCESDYFACLSEDCLEEFEPFYACSLGQLKSGVCEQPEGCIWME